LLNPDGDESDNGIATPTPLQGDLSITPVGNTKQQEETTP